MTYSPASSLSGRQIHLDFHTSPAIPDVGVEFNADDFARTLRESHVNSVTVFGKCHHGMCYYPTHTGTAHPALAGRDLLGEQIQALHRAGIRAPIYTTVVWEEDAAQKHPEWRQIRRDGAFAGTSMATDYSGPHPGAWKWLNFLHPDYQDYIEAHVREILDRYGDDVDGLFFDILMMHADADWSESSVAFRQAHGLMSADAETHARFESLAQRLFTQRFSGLLRDRRPNATVFYNSGHHLFVTGDVGARARLSASSHVEIESLPSGFWGYHHFPRMARLVSTWRRDDGSPISWLGMTGRFQRQWGDFGDVKPQPALEYECFRAQALGGGCSVGDQLPPRGVLDPAAYDLIGSVYAQVAAAEPFYAGSEPLPQVGVVLPGYPGRDEQTADLALEGAVMFCEESHYECVALDERGDLSGLDLVILPDSVVITKALGEKLSRYYEAGGCLLLSYKSGFDAHGEWALPFLSLAFEGETSSWPTYWRTRPEFSQTLSRSDRVVYGRGVNITPRPEMEILIERVSPYFQRTDIHFSSHFQTPPVRDAGPFPAAVAGERFVCFADPIFGEYRQTGNLAVRDGAKAAAERLIGPPTFGSGLPTTVLCTPRRRGDDLLLTLLHYIPVRKSLDIDIIEERSSFAELTLRLPGHRQVRVFGAGELSPGPSDGEVELPHANGRLLLEIPDYFTRG
ncbi:hypothetical protein CCAX7_45450 [Capsulimonas corticalis]|uniref:Uncharacterized protein n=1 Tax=Capsulimonas corticalis TaxID=2219043 RepID=A0A402D673_9BACT|nr:alpha-L-fucosidase [Capsulimonas corticalis]BDI32494.1 hypothetical protein CCAX7_45450 [Capsulimonas corticalis]